jgi:hypothetical protein
MKPYFCELGGFNLDEWCLGQLSDAASYFSLVVTPEGKKHTASMRCQSENDFKWKSE